MQYSSFCYSYIKEIYLFHLHMLYLKGCVKERGFECRIDRGLVAKVKYLVGYSLSVMYVNVYLYIYCVHMSSNKMVV